jgi:phage FluMu protein Com
MQIRCTNCHRPFAISKAEVIASLERMTADEMTHLDLKCPHCRRVNRVSKDELLHSVPTWKPQTQEEKAE